VPHYKCTTCRTRLRVSVRPAELVGDLCPKCGSLLEPATGLETLVGFAAIERLDAPGDAPQSPTRQHVAERLDDFVTRRGARLNHERPDTEPWPEADELAVALAVPQPF
jgi:Zn-finger nucleic acid-binding protein